MVTVNIVSIVEKGQKQFFVGIAKSRIFRELTVSLLSLNSSWKLTLNSLYIPRKFPI